MENQVNQSERLKYLDIAKGIGIILVVLGHCGTIPDLLKNLIFSVHMPLFFILSGYTFKLRREEGFSSFFKKNAKALLLPYGLTCLFVIFFRLLRTLLEQGSRMDLLREFCKWTVASIYGSGTRMPEFLNTYGIPNTYIGAIWFLLALFFAKLLFYWIARSRNPILWSLISFFAGVVSARKLGWFPFSIQAGFCAVLFVCVGYYIRQKDLFSRVNTSLVLKLSMLLVWVYCWFYCGQLWMVSNTFSDGALDVIGAICGSFVLVFLSDYLGKVPVLGQALSILGKMSLGIMCAHLIVLDCFPMWDVIPVLNRHLSLPLIVYEVLLAFIMAAIMSLIFYFIPRVKKIVYPALFR